MKFGVNIATNSDSVSDFYLCLPSKERIHWSFPELS